MGPTCDHKGLWKREARRSKEEEGNVMMTRDWSDGVTSQGIPQILDAE